MSVYRQQTKAGHSDEDQDSEAHVQSTREAEQGLLCFSDVGAEKAGNWSRATVVGCKKEAEGKKKSWCRDCDPQRSPSAPRSGVPGSGFASGTARPSEQAPRPGRTQHEAFPARLPLRQHPQQQEQGPPPPRYLAVHFSPPLRRDPRTRLPRGPAYSSAAGSGHRPRLPPATTERRNGRNTQSRTSGWAGRVVHRTGGSGRKSRGHARSRAAHAPRMLRVWLFARRGAEWEMRLLGFSSQRCGGRPYRDVGLSGSVPTYLLLLCISVPLQGGRSICKIIPCTVLPAPVLPVAQPSSMNYKRIMPVNR